MSLVSVLKKVGGVVTSVAASAVSAIPVVGKIASSVLSDVSSKLLASPTPVKQAAAALVTNVTPPPSTIAKASSIALQLDLPAKVTSVIKQAGLDLVGATVPSVTPSTSAIPAATKVTSPLNSLVADSPAAKTPEDLSIGKKTGQAKKTNWGLIIGGIAVFLFGFIFLFTRKRR